MIHLLLTKLYAWAERDLEPYVATTYRPDGTVEVRTLERSAARRRGRP